MPIDVESMRADPEFRALPPKNQQALLTQALRENGGVLPPFAATAGGLSMPASRVGLVGSLARRQPTGQEISEFGAPMLGQAAGTAALGPLGGTAGAMTLFALQRRVQTGEWPGWRELGFQGAMALAMPMVSGIMRGVQSGLRVAPPGRMALRTEALTAFEQSRAGTEQQIAALRGEAGASVAQLERMAAQTKALREDYLRFAKDAEARDITAARLRVQGLRERTVQTARDFVAKLPVLSEDEISALYAKVDQHQFTLPTTLVRDAQRTIAADVEMVRKFFPQANVGERARLAAGAPAISEPSAQLSFLPQPLVQETMTFQETRGLLKWLGQRIGSLQTATTPDAGEQLGAAKLLYANLQRTLDMAVDQGTLPTQARLDLRAANLAYKQSATVDALADAVESAIGTTQQGQVTLNAGRLLDTLRKGKQGTFLADRLREVGLYEQVEQTFTQMASGIRKAAEEIPTVRGAFARQRSEIVPALREQEMAMRAAAAQTQQQGAQRVQGLQATVRAQEAALPPLVPRPSFQTMRDVGIAAGGVTALITGGQFPVASGVGAFAATPFVLARLLMTGPGQRLVSRVLHANGGVLDEPTLQLLASAVLRTAGSNIGGMIGSTTQGTTGTAQSLMPSGVQ